MNPGYVTRASKLRRPPLARRCHRSLASRMHRTLVSRSSTAVVRRVVASVERARVGACAPTRGSGSAVRASRTARAPTRGIARSAIAAAEAPNDASRASDGQAALAWKAALDFKFVRDNAEAVQRNATVRKVDVSVKDVVAKYEALNALNFKCDEIREKRNANAKSMKGKLEKETRDALIAEGKALKDELAELEIQASALENELQIMAQRLPNMTHPDVPEGGEENATVLTTVGAQRAFTFPVQNHVDIGEKLGMFDFETGSKVSGSRFVYLTGVGAMLELALINWAFAKVVSKGFKPMMVPDMVRSSVVEKCGFQPRAENTQVYSIENSDLCMAGTAELLLGGVYMDEVVEESQLPIKMAAFSHCFRTEAGAAGAQTRGMYRLHQFSKVEMFVISTPEQSDALHEELRGIETEMFQELGFHFKVLDMPTEDLGAPAYRKFDIEAWMPALERYGEISSASNCTDYQARRLNIKYRPNAVDGKKQALVHCHTLNATACAIPRMIVTILENFQQEDGSVIVPEPLRPYLGGLDVLRPEKK